MENLPSDILNSLQWYLGDNRVLAEVFVGQIDTRWIHEKLYKLCSTGTHTYQMCDMKRLPDYDPQFILYIEFIRHDPINFNLFTNLIELDITNAGQQQLNYLPTSLKRLHCMFSGLTTLPELPQSLTLLQCDCNNLQTLPPLPPSLEILTCTNNFLMSLPPLPQGLWQLNCEGNQLTTLPQLPQSLTHFYCRSNRLTHKPPKPPHAIDWFVNDPPNVSTL